MAKVSIIMPALNVVEYITQCLESVVKQTLSDIEIIIVDAGSTDGTIEIIKSYAETDKRIQIIHSPVRSYGKQMNMGISIATGEYIGIVETDDFVDRQMYEELVAYADKYDADFVKGYARGFFDLPGGFTYAYDLDRYKSFGKEYVYCPKNKPEMLLSEYHIWLGIYRRSFLSNISFNESPGAAFQDIGFLFQTIIKANKAVYVDTPVYWYRQSNESSSVYRPCGFDYLIGEYYWSKQFLVQMTLAEKKFFYLKIFALCLGRFQLMILAKNDWGNVEKQILYLHDQLKNAVKQNIVRFDGNARELHALLKLFLIRPIDVVDFYKEEYAVKRENLKKMVSWCFGKKIVIWGSGEYGKFIHAVLMRYGNISVDGFIDSNPELWGQQVQGVSIYKPRDLINMFCDCFFIIAVKGYEIELENIMSDYGVDSSRIFVNIVAKDPLLLI